MSNKIVLLFILWFPLGTYAQLTYTINGYGKGFKEGDKIFLLYREPGKTVSTADSTLVEHGRFEFKGAIKNVVKGGIYRNTNPVYNNDIEDAINFYVEPGNIILQSADTLMGAILSGTPLNADYNELRQSLMINSKLGDDQMQSVKFAFIKRHPNSYVSLVTLGELSTNKKLLPEVEALFPVLSNDLKANPIGKKILERISFAKKINVGMMAKDFSQQDAKGKMVKLSNYKGKYVLVDFWASWCLPCREENPNVVAAYHKYKEKGFTVLGVSLDDKNGKAAWLKAIKDDGLAWKQVSDLNGWKNEVAILYGITSIPANVLIDPAGKIIAKDLKGKFLNERLAAIFGVN